MVEVRRYSVSSGEVGSGAIDEKPFGRVLRRSLKDAVVMYEANKRQGTVQTKERSDVAGTSKKPYKQKHTGRARAGSGKSPIWRGGGTVFGPHPRSHRWRMPRKMKHAALRSTLAGKLRADEVVLIEGLNFEAPSAKRARKILDELDVRNSCLVVIEEYDSNVLKSFRNFPRVAVRRAGDLNAYDVCYFKNILVTPQAMEQLRAKVGLDVE